MNNQFGLHVFFCVYVHKYVSNILSNLDITLTDSILILIKIIINYMKSSLDNQTHEIQIEEIKTPDFYFTVARFKKKHCIFLHQQRFRKLSPSQWQHR